MSYENHSSRGRLEIVEDAITAGDITSLDEVYSGSNAATKWGSR